MKSRLAGWCVRWFLGWLALLAPPTLSAQSGSWAEYLAAWRKLDHPPVTLLVPKDGLTPGFARSDEAILFLTTTGDLGVQTLEGPVLDSIRESRGWKAGSPWVLVGEDGSILDEGRELPTGEQLQGRLRALGMTPTWEALDQFLRLHPGNGSALQGRLSIAMRLARRRFQNLRDRGKAETPKVSSESAFLAIEPAKMVDQANSGEWCREVEDTLHRLNQMPDPWRLGEKVYFQVWLDFYGQVAPFSLRQELAALKESILEAWERSPHSELNTVPARKEDGNAAGLGGFWISCDAATRPSGALSELPRLIPTPGRFWPHPDLLWNLPSPRPNGTNAQEILSFLDSLPEDPEVSLLWNDAWSEWLHFKSFVSFHRARALASQGRWQEAALALQELRRWSGKHWTDTASSLLSVSSNVASPDPRGKTEAPAEVALPDVFKDVLRLPALEELVPPPPPVPLRFLVWGQPAWMSQWEALRSTPLLAPWSASELMRESPREEDTIRLAQAGFPATGWAVFRGDSTILARGESLPEVEGLAMRLRDSTPSRLHMLDAFVANHPEHLDARKDRFALVRSRMPQAALEFRLMEDAAKAHLPLDFGPEAPWISDLEGWRAKARSVVPELGAVLQRWPDNAGLWRVWVSWAAFHPKPTAVVAFAAGLPVFGSRPRWISRLPAEVHRAVAKECRKERRFGPMAEWFEGAWTQMMSGTQGSNQPAFAEREMAIHEGYREALMALGRKAELADLERAWATLHSKRKGDPPS